MFHALFVYGHYLVQYMFSKPVFSTYSFGKQFFVFTFDVMFTDLITFV